MLLSRLREMRGRWQQQGLEGEEVLLVRKRRGAKRQARKERINWETFQNFRGNAQELEPFQLLFIKIRKAGAEIQNQSNEHCFSLV